MFKQIACCMFVFMLLLGISLFAEEDAAKINAKFGDFGVMGVHYFTLKDSSSVQEFETMAKELVDKVNKAIPGQKWFVMKADRGEVDGSYVLIVLLDSIERRNYYYPL